MNESMVFADEVLDRLRERHPRYHETAYLFVLSALHHVLERLDEPRHISGRELAEGARDLALHRYGPMARAVLTDPVTLERMAAEMQARREAVGLAAC